MTVHVGKSELRSPRTRREALDLVATVSMIATCLIIVLALAKSWASPLPGRTADRRAEPPLPKAAIPIASSARLGNPVAPVVMVVFSEFECPYCARFSQQTMPSIVDKYVDTGKMQLVFKNSPLPSHVSAFGAAEAGVCADRQHQFWRLHDVLFKRQRELGRPALLAAAKDVGLDLKTFERCLGGESADQVQAELELAKELEVRGTPTFFLGKRVEGEAVAVMSRISGARPLAEFEKAIEAALPPRR